jgi:prephenate dehydrogenase
VLALPPERHDDLVATVSHVPHLAAAALMVLAADGAEEHAALLRLAAGGFRDMTRIAAGHPGIWPDICAENRDAIVKALDELQAALSSMRDLVVLGDRPGLLDALERARHARTNLPVRGEARPIELAEVRVPVLDRPGVLAEVTTLLGELGVNIVDIEIAHSTEGPHGVLLVVVDAGDVPQVRDALGRRGYRVSSAAL